MNHLCCVFPAINTRVVKSGVYVMYEKNTLKLACIFDTATKEKCLKPDVQNFSEAIMF